MDPNNFSESMYHGVSALMKKYFPFFFKRADTEEESVELFKLHYETLDYLHSNASTVSFIYNHKTLSYDYFSPNIKNIMGYDNHHFQEGGLKFSMSLVLPEHSKIYNRNILPIMFKYYSIYSIKKRVKDLKFSFTFKIKRYDGEYIWMLHHMSALQLNNWGFPVRTLVQLTDVSEIKRGHTNTIDLSIFAKSKDQIYKPVFSKIYSEENKFSLSERELDILYLLNDGKTTKEISELLNISAHTVNTHRKNMLRKSRAKNTLELIKNDKNKLWKLILKPKVI